MIFFSFEGIIKEDEPKGTNSGRIHPLDRRHGGNLGLCVWHHQGERLGGCQKLLSRAEILHLRYTQRF